MHIHSTPETFHYLNAETFAKMKPGMRILNFARGELVDDDALLAAIESGQVARYVTDFPNAKLVGKKNVVCFPHLGATTPEAEEKCAVMAAREIVDYLRNGNIRNSVNLPNATLDRLGKSRLCLIHRNRPGMLNRFLEIIAAGNVNVEHMLNKARGEIAYTIFDTTEHLDETAAEEMRAIPGVTRDRIYGESEWLGRKFRLVDTGGIEPSTDNQILSFMREQAQIAIDNATVIVFVTDIKTGMTAADQEVAGMLQRSKKPIVLAVNKMDATGTVDPDFYEFYNLGLGDPVAVSAVHGHGTGDLLDECLKYFPTEEDEDDESDVIQVAIIGKPNVGKSSLTNRILGEQRVIVSNVAGTTRDAIDSYFENAQGKYNFIDTAGMRKKSKVDDNIEKYSVLRATMAIERSDVCLIMIDANDGVTEQDTKVAGLAHEAGKACIIVVNKWDMVEKDGKTMDRMREDIRRDLSYMTYAPILFISALTGQRVTRLFELINYVNNQASTRITTGMLNSVLADAQTRVQPPTDKGRRLKIYYMTQVGIKPPHFVIFCNDKKLFHFSYRRYLENQIRSVFGLEGTPVILSIRQKGDDDN